MRMRRRLDHEIQSNVGANRLLMVSDSLCGGLGAGYGLHHRHGHGCQRRGDPQRSSRGQQCGGGISRKAATNGSGDFLFASLPIGSYDLTVTSTGFKKYEAKGVVLNVGEKARVNVALEVGASQH